MKVFYLMGLYCPKIRHSASLLLMGLRDKLSFGDHQLCLKKWSKLNPASISYCLPGELLTLEREIDLCFGENAIQQERDKVWKCLTSLLIGKSKTLSELLPDEISSLSIRFKQWGVFSYDQNEQIDYQKGGTGYA
jgi:hypothetical protein